MGAKDNFSQAVKDLLYKSETDEIPGTAEPAVQVHPAAVHIATAQPDILRMETAAPVRTPLSDSITAGVSTVAAGTLIIGEIHSKGDLNLLGDIQGNVETKGNVTLGGKVIGNVEGRDVNCSKSSIKGNVVASGCVQLDPKSTIFGDVTAKNISCGGRMKGNLVIEGKAHFLNETILVGNVCAGSLVIEEGARIKGDVSTSSQGPSDMEDPFKDL